MPLEHSGFVTEVADGLLGVRVVRPKSCVSCSNHSSCGNQLLNRGTTGDFLLPVQKAERFTRGSCVSIEMAGAGLGRLTVLCYLMPALLMVCGAWLGSGLMAQTDLGSLLGAAGGLAVGSGLLSLYDALGGGHAWIRRIVVRPHNRGQA
jgi:positive regulator of sigma E activity